MILKECKRLAKVGFAAVATPNSPLFHMDSGFRQFTVGRKDHSAGDRMNPVGIYEAEADQNPLPRYDALVEKPSRAPLHWAASCTHQECSLHHLSPYIGKMKSVIASDLISTYTQPEDLVVDPFCGCGTVPLEAARLGRRVFASDASLYAITLTKGKLRAPMTLEKALERLDLLLRRVESLPLPDLRSVPRWVRGFFHPRTLKETLRLTTFLKRERESFFLAALLGILHHQRPGFLSFPSSHLVPYLRSAKFPKGTYPEMYEYRAIQARLRAKVERTLKRLPVEPLERYVTGIRHAFVETVTLPDNIDCVVTSPPYMNALDYVRDNRLRLWFLDGPYEETQKRALTSLSGFNRALKALARKLEKKIRLGGVCIFIVGEKKIRKGSGFPSEALTSILAEHAPTLKLCHIVSDVIPDIRRSRRRLAGVKKEHILVFRKK